MQDNEFENKREQMEQISEALGSYFEKEEMEVGMVMSVLFTMLINTMLGHANVPPQEAIRLFTNAVCDYVDREGEEVDVEVKPNEEKMQWLN
jgi:glycine cleavage system aminomethyltransferase T